MKKSLTALALCILVSGCAASNGGGHVVGNGMMPDDYSSPQLNEDCDCSKPAQASSCGCAKPVKKKASYKH